jgi:hypothetical protein
MSLISLEEQSQHICWPETNVECRTVVLLQGSMIHTRSRALYLARGLRRIAIGGGDSDSRLNLPRGANP